MNRATSLLLSGILALSFALATPALALNPQPLPPGFHAPTGTHGVSAFVASHRGQLYPCRLAMCRR
jgi:hypothetical protein